MTPILRNRHEKVQEATINLIGRIGMFFVMLLPFVVLITSVQPIVALSLSLLANGCVSASNS